LNRERIRNFPISFFAVSMGLTGVVLMVEKMAHIFSLPAFLPNFLLFFSFSVFLLIGGMYLSKMISYPQVAARDLIHPVKMHFLPTFSVSLLLLSVAFLGGYPGISRVLWILGTAFHLVLTLYTLSSWVQHQHFEIHHANPSWFIPILGNLVVPVAGVVHAPFALNWFFFSVGLFFWILLFAVLLNRIIFHHPVTDKLIPTFFILMAPPAVAFISYVKLTGRVDLFAQTLYSLAIFLFLMIISQWRLFSRIRFYLSWWAYSFPLAALGLASFLMYSKTGVDFYLYVWGFFLVFLMAVAGVLLVLTARHIRAGEICVEE